MDLKKLMFGGLGVVICGVVVIYHLAYKHTNAPENQITIGILQTASHPALDAARDGFVDELKKSLPDKHVVIIVQNGQGSVSQLQSMAQSLHVNKNVEAIYAIATPAAQAIARIEKQKPIVIAAVTDPQAAGLLTNNTNVCGTQDMIDVKQAADLIQKFVPTAKQVALLYNPGEVNSMIMIEKMRSELESRGLKAINAGITSEAELPAVVTMACKNADVLWAPTDNLVALMAGTIALKAKAAGKLFIASDTELAKKGVAVASGIDYRASGEQAADMLASIIDDYKNPTVVGIKPSRSDQIVVDKKALEEMGIQIPEGL
jgi:putative tryptophan/tyrosine transport system substrate-binding protein